MVTVLVGGGMPGLLELAVLVGMLVLFLAFAFAVVAVARALTGRAGGRRADRVADLEARVDELEAELADATSGDDSDAASADRDDDH